MMKRHTKIFAMVLLSSSALCAQIQSTYTKSDNKSCKVVQSDNTGYSSVSVCPEYAGIKVEIRESDMRQDMTLVRKGKQYNLEFRKKISQAFSSFGPVLEWRFSEGKVKTPTAMISRFIAADKYVDGIQENVSYLVVTKITDKKMCIVGKVYPGKNQNVKARRLADKSQTISCLKAK